MPDGVTGAVPAMLLIAGSGPTDRNGDSKVLNGPVGTLRFLADVLARNGIASLRYDKVGTGQTGLGSLQPTSLGFDEFVREAADATNYLAAQPGIDRAAIGIVGHSEGGLIALAVANGKGGQIPAVTSLSLLESATGRILDILSRQIDAQIAQSENRGGLSPNDVASLRASLAAVVTQLRMNGTVPDDVPMLLQQDGLVPANAKILASEDLLDPAALAATLHAPLRVFTSCSDKDINISCDDVAKLDEALKQTTLQQVHLTTTDHVLKDVGNQPSTGAEYIQPLPYSQQLTAAWTTWLHASR
ncbi:alpha/beta hydrolase family protein [Nocardia sp. NPDC004722]